MLNKKHQMTLIVEQARGILNEYSQDPDLPKYSFWQRAYWQLHEKFEGIDRHSLSFGELETLTAFTSLKERVPRPKIQQPTFSQVC